VLIARREGHRAVMRPGVSAWTVSAPISASTGASGHADPRGHGSAHRRRRPDTALHLVLWQVGLIGELGFAAAAT
jgi:hypothetical protein